MAANSRWDLIQRLKV